MTNFIEVLSKEERWVNWKLEERKGKNTKIPYDAKTGNMASSGDPKTWSTYDEVKSISKNVGIVFTHRKDILGIDIDHCLENGEIVHEDKEKIERLIIEADTYTEISPSMKGLHLYLIVTEPFTLLANRKGAFEVYNSGRYFTVTEASFGEEKPLRTVASAEAIKLLEIVGYPWGKDVKQEKREIKSSKNNLSETGVLEKMFNSKNGEKIKKLYEGDVSKHGDDDSVADMALCSHLAFWTGKNAALMEQIWLKSPLGSREKTQRIKGYRERTINAAVAQCSKTFKPKRKEKKEQSENNSQVGRLLKIIEEQKSLEFFHDEYKNAYIRFEIDNTKENWPVGSSNMQSWLGYIFWKSEKEPLRPDTIKNITGLFESRARYEGLEYPLNIRIAKLDDELWYDLVNKKWETVRINKNGWEIINNSPILFKRSLHNQSQVIPEKGGDVKLFLKYVNVKNSEDKLLLLVFLISCFISDFSHPVMVIFGSHGSAKSFLSKLLRRIIDPSIIDVVSIPETNKEIIQAFFNNYFLFFDNVSYLHHKVSDIFCRVVTGGGFVKRKLNKNNEDVIYKIRRPIGMNGINLVGTQPDLLDRSFLLELERIEPKERRLDNEIMSEFEKDLPLILGGVFDVLVKTLQIKPSIELDWAPRMADFASWGSAIAVALGYSQEEFISAYKNNINSQNEVALDENIVATAIISLMENIGGEDWKGTASELLDDLNSNLSSGNLVNTFEQYWPKSSNNLMKRLNVIKPNLKEIGIIFNSVSDGRKKVITIKNTKFEKKKETQEKDYDTDDMFKSVKK